MQHYGYAGAAGCGLEGLPGSGGGDSTRSPHQVTSALGAAYQYDARGNQTLADRSGATDDRHIRYSQADQAIEIAKGSATAPTQRTRFWYGADGQRYKREDSGSSGTLCTHYVGGVEVIRGTCTGAATSTATPTFKRMLAGLLQERKGTTITDQVLLNDHLGSIVKIVSPSGATIAAMDFAAFGQRRSLSDPRQYGITPPTQTNRGFTGHEHVDGLDVIHMNGRIYDPRLGRFLQADPIIQDPTNGQNFNRYTYVWNNPLAFTDPSGYSSVGKWLRTIVAIVVTIYTGGAAAGMWSFFGASITAGSTAALGVAMAGGFVAGAIQTGTLKGGLQGAFSAALFVGVGKLATSFGMAEGSLGRAAMHGVAGGVLSDLQGGKFGHGFLSAGLSKAVMVRIDTGSTFADGALSAIAGGTISELTGGKFANGAVTAAMQFAFNRLSQQAAAARFREKANISFNGEGADRLEASFNDMWKTSAGFRGSVMAAHARWGSLEYTGVYGSGESSYTQPGGSMVIDLNSSNMLIETQMTGGYFDTRAAEVRARYQRLSVGRVLLHETLHSAFSQWGVRDLVSDSDERRILNAENRLVKAEGLFDGRARTGHADYITSQRYRDLLDGY